jgi:glutamate---cysteine ligase / carboxylate-amine ligase
MAGRSDEDLAIAARAAFDDPVSLGLPPRTQPASQARAAMNVLPAWAHWNPAAPEPPWTVGVEEEVMLVDPGDWSLASRIDDVLPALSRRVAAAACAETHGSALELASRPHPTAAAAAAELADLRAGLVADLGPLGLRAAVAGTHPFALWSDVEVSRGARYQSIYASMRELARREPTFALHVHVAVPGAEAAVRALRGLRVHVPLLLALSANSPFWQGRDTGLASARVPVFGVFPRVGIPRAFGSYAEYVDAIDVLLRCRAFPEPTFLWWDVRLQPKLGTIEVRILDAQTRAEDNAALAALVQSVVRLEATEGHVATGFEAHPEVLDENRFLATRDGMLADFIYPEGDRRPAREILDDLLAACAPHAAELGCEAELAAVATLADDPGYQRQRMLAGVRQGEPVGPAIGMLVCALAADFTAGPRERVALV